MDQNLKSDEAGNKRPEFERWTLELFQSSTYLGKKGNFWFFDITPLIIDRAVGTNFKFVKVEKI